MMKSYNCYIEEYNNGKSARLRVKKTNIKVSFFSKNKLDKNNLLQFMSSAKMIPLDIYNQDCSDSIFIKGNCVSESDDEIIIAFDENLTYLFQ